MEQNPNAETTRRNTMKQKKIRRIVLAIVLLLIAAIGAVLLIGAWNSNDTPAAGVMRYGTTRIAEGEIHTTVSGSGTLIAKESRTVTAPADAHVKAVYKRPGDAVAAGETVLVLSSDTVEEELASLYDELQTAQTRLAGTTKTRANGKITAPRKGIVKALAASVGDAAEDLSYLCKIATDGLMQLTIDAPEGLRRYETVQVSIGGETVEGTVETLSDGKAVITVEDNAYAVGTAALAFDAAGKPIGSGHLDVNDHVLVLADAGCIEEVRIEENESVSKNAVLFVLRSDAPSATYLSRLSDVESLEAEIKELEDSLRISAEWDGLLAALYVGAGDKVESGESVCLLTSTEGYQLELGIDELDIASIAIGQPATLTLDAIEGEYTGSVTNLSYDGSGSYVTTYTATVATEAIDGAYPGMSVSAEIITETSGTALIVPVAAVQYEGRDTFLYLAPAEGSNAQADIDPAALTRISVETGMSDGSYIVVSGDGLSVGDRIYVPMMETTAVYVEEESAASQFSGMGGMPNMGGSQMRNFGGSMGNSQRPNAAQRPNMGNDRGNRGN